MKSQKTSANRSRVGASFFLGGTILFLALTFPLQADSVKGRAGALSGTAKVFRARNSANVVVYLEGEGITKEYDPPSEHGVINQKDLVFIPRVLPILKGTAVDFTNSDDVQHNIFSPGQAEKFNLGSWGRGEVRDFTFKNPGEVVVLCNVHSDMISFVIILENPYFAKTDEQGNFRIDNIPPGTYTVKTWHERLKSDPQELTITEGETTEISLELRTRK